MVMRHVSGAILGLVVAVGSAQAGVVNLGGGWEASWDASLDPFVDVQSFGVAGGDTLVIQKSAEFTAFPQTIDILFTQVDPAAVPYIAIDDEIITNSTPVDWTDFHLELIGNAAFDPAQTLASGGGGPVGWTIDPFTNAFFGPNDQSLWIDGGVVSSGSQWFPGDGATDGLLFIDAMPGATAPNTFVLREFPTPAPGTIGLLALSGVVAARRRR